MKPLSIFSQNLRTLRTSAKLTQTRLAGKLGITQRAYSSYETSDREPDIEMIRKMAAFFHVSLDFLLNGKEFNEDAIAREDQELIDLFRALSREQQVQVTAYIQTLIASKKIDVDDIEQQA